MNFHYKIITIKQNTNQNFTNMKTENYLSIVKALEALMKRAMNLRIKKEDPYGEIKTFKISGIRIAYLREEKYNLPYLNAIPGRTETYKYAPEMLITFFYKGKEKQVDYSISLKNSYLSNYNGILTSGWARLANGIDGLLDEFYGSTLEDKKLYLESEVSPAPHMKDEEFELPNLEQVPKEFASDFQEMLKNYYLSAPIAELDASISSNRKVWIVVDSKGTRVIQKQDITRFTIDPWGVSKTKRMFTDGVYRMATSFEALKSEFPSAKHELQKFLYTLDRKQLPSGIYPLIFDHSATATLFHEAIAGHMLSGRYIVEEDSTIFKGKLGKCVATDTSMSILKKLQIWDCPQDTSMLAHYKYDMEGVPAVDTLLIDKGVVKNYLHDRNSAARMKKKSNGHALAEDFQQNVLINFFLTAEARLPEPRVSNLKVLSDSKVTFKDLEEKFFKEYGYYILVKSYAGQVDVTTGTFELKVESLEKVYADGSREYFHGGAFSSNLTDFISAVKEVSNQYGMTGGYCGSSSGSVPTQEYTPAMSVYGVNWAPSALPEKDKRFCISKVKYIPRGWKATEEYEI